MKKCLLLLLFGIFIALGVNSCFAIQIGLEEDIKSTYVGTSKPGQITDGRSGKLLFNTKELTPYAIKPHNNVLAIKVGRQHYSLGTNYIVVKPKDDKGFTATKRKWYRGEIVIYNVNKRLIVINRLPLEEYLLGVVPAEMPSKWNFEAHKAQAIAARSYAVANLGKRKSKGYDLKDTPQDQAYGGASAETAQTSRAVSSTRGIVITHGGKVIPAYYHASSGGHTLPAGAVWAHNLPYIKAVPGQDGGVRKNGHGVGMSQHGANNLANKGYTSFEILNYFYQNIKFAVIKTQI
ncbi:stage II sporulation protein D [Candidatus Gastranaerophilus sp. (ex Termes propinquus)]|nr:stage II sporulation protein D [Candidatus Gastranaerophilus sp. (ex Termes propinquus)]